MEQKYDRELRKKIIGTINLPIDAYKAIGMLKRIEGPLYQYGHLLQEKPELEVRLIGLVNRAIRKDRFDRAVDALERLFGERIVQPVTVFA